MVGQRFVVLALCVLVAGCAVSTQRRAERALYAGHYNDAIHLFQAGPMGLALLLGNRWNRLRPTTVYEDVNAQQVYEKAFVIDA